MVNCENPKCGKVLKLRPGQKRLNPKRRFCDSKCATRHRSYKIFLKLRNDPEYRKKKNKYFSNWYQKHQKHQNENVIRNYHEHKDEWRERRFIGQHRQEFLNLINQKCQCGKPVKVIHHMTYLFKRDWIGVPHNPIIPSCLAEYSQFLIGFCSKECHAGFHRKQRDCPEFVSLSSAYKLLKRIHTLI